MTDLIRLPRQFDRNEQPESVGAPETLLLPAPPAWRKFAAPVGAIAILLAVGWGVGARIDNFGAPSAEQVAAKAAADSAAKALQAEQAQRQELAALRSHVEGLKAKLEAQAQKAHASETSVAALQKSLAEEKAEAAAATAQLQARIERIQAQAQQTAKAPEKPAEKLAAKQPEAIDHTPVGTVASPLPKTLPKPLTPYRAFVLRDVNRGLAVVEGGGQLEEVGPGDTLPGGARVDRIEKRGAQWVVVTDHGYIATNGGGRWED